MFSLNSSIQLGNSPVFWAAAQLSIRSCVFFRGPTVLSTKYKQEKWSGFSQFLVWQTNLKAFSKKASLHPCVYAVTCITEIASTLNEAVNHTQQAIYQIMWPFERFKWIQNKYTDWDFRIQNELDDSSKRPSFIFPIRLNGWTIWVDIWIEFICSDVMDSNPHVYVLCSQNRIRVY